MDRDLFEQALRGHSGASGESFDAAHDRKTLQLCRQVERALSLALAGDRHEVLRDLTVDAVEPMGSAAQLLVRVLVPASVEVSVIEVIGILDGASPRLRAVVAQSICRKRTPSLSFLPVPLRAGNPSDVTDAGNHTANLEGGDHVE
ncbi:hypothetical protein [Humisphaera borealis]|uniref:Ribosome-binding factor A n=1 Tax=Humisphaera borealis TaxID=2807512 RepID=A0A7M2WU18_9BACT|nr:hypothetical protein [Humisphaera borealis]QOV88976.1 hypothetical protein IPV69_22550 [Humisphaera borealis]